MAQDMFEQGVGEEVNMVRVEVLSQDHAGGAAGQSDAWSFQGGH